MRKKLVAVFTLLLPVLSVFAAEEEGMTFVMPTTVIPAETERMNCFVLPWVPDQDYFVTRFEGLQGDHGYHLLPFISIAELPPEPGTVFDCSDMESMVSLLPLILEPKDKSLLPEGFAIKIPKGSIIILQSHYDNPEERHRLVSDVGRFVFYTGKEAPTLVSYMILTETDIELPPGKAEVNAECGIEIDYKVIALRSHMHGLGTKISVARERNGRREMIYKMDHWDHHFAHVPPAGTYPRDQSLKFLSGDRIYLRCEYDNNTGRIVEFPEEMCAMIAHYYPAPSKESRHPSGVVVCN